MRPKKRPKVTVAIGKTSPRLRKELTDPKDHKPLWAFSIFDYAGQWGFEALKEANHNELITQLGWCESMTWFDIEKASGGRRAGRGNNSHFVPVEQLCRTAQNRLRELKQDDIDSIFSLRLKSGIRIYGVREGSVLKILWFDPWHKDNSKAVCPTSN